MKRTSLTLAGLLVFSCIGNAQAQLYKWVGPDGKITYSDLPPPKSARQLEKPALESGEPATGALSYALAETSKNHPVTLFTGVQCAPCAEARDFLKKRGIPFAEKSVTSNEDVAKLRQVSGDTQLPVLLIGRDKQIGFEPDAWNLALSAASYPQDNNLPKDYRFAPAEPAAPRPQATQAKPEKAANPDSRTNPAATTQPRLPASGNAPPGFRF